MFRYIATISGLLITLSFTSCAPAVQDAVSSPDPKQIASVAAQGPFLHGSKVVLGNVVDGRESAKEFEEKDPDITEPIWPSEESVSEALRESLTKRGAQISEGAEKVIDVTVLRWESRIKSGLNSQIQSTAAVEVSVKSKSGRELYSGRYQGERSSQFPVVSRNDIQDSLGLAMGAALGQALDDKELQANINVGQF